MGSKLPLGCYFEKIFVIFCFQIPFPVHLPKWTIFVLLLGLLSLTKAQQFDVENYSVGEGLAQSQVYALLLCSEVPFSNS